MDINEQIELLADVWKDQMDDSMNKNIGDSLENKVEVRSVNFSIEQKLDKIIELLEKLAKDEDYVLTTEENNQISVDISNLQRKRTNTLINSPISVKSEEKNVNLDINKHLYDLANKLHRRKGESYSILQELNPSKEESIERAKGINWYKIIEPKIKIACKDEKGEILTLEGTVQENGDIVCEPMTESRTIVGWSLNNENKVIPSVLNTKSTNRIPIDVFKQQVNTNMFVKVGTMTDSVLTLDVPKSHVTNSAIFKPTTYFTDWFVKNTYPELGCEWLEVHPFNKVNEILIKENYVTDFVTTGYLTEDGRAVYYDQYI